MNDVFYPGPIHVAYSPFDPFDIGEPRTFSEDDARPAARLDAEP